MIPAEMEVGQVIEVEETALNSAGTLRVRFDKGWTSMASGSGVKILERCDAGGNLVAEGGELPRTPMDPDWE